MRLILYVMQIGARCMIRGREINMQFYLLYAQPRIRYERRILYEIQNSCMCLYVYDTWGTNTWHTRLILKLDLKLNQKLNLKLNPNKILSFNAINKTPC